MKATKVVFGIVTLMAVLAMQVQAQPCLTNGLVAYYPFTGNANDASGNGNHGNVFGAALAADRFGISNSCYSFDGISSYIKASANALPTTTRTISLWFNESSLSGKQSVLLGYGGDYGLAGPSSFFMYFLRFANGCGIDSHYSGGDPRATYVDWRPHPIINNTWHQWVVTVSDSEVRFFWDGVQVLTSPTVFRSTYTSGKDFCIGVDVSGNGIGPYADQNVGYFDGLIDDIRIYSRVLSTNEIQQLYCCESPLRLSIRISQVELCWDTTTTNVYRLLYRESLTNSPWLPLGGPVFGDGSRFCTNDTVLRGQPQRYYQLIILPDPPTGVSASDGTYTDKVRMTWNEAPGATAYEVWRHTSNNSGSADQIARGLSSTTYDDTSGTAGITYYYWVKASNVGRTSDFSGSDSGYR
jgi:hypothetical protein